ncbi:hypothetical protein SO802_010478 [Lithocarpus litseifolius]|uniref:Uncharacterized protein n=1 Tax=Lithocarpus litseifolius TaxID=425828 RepID=A0AAW2DJY5_9ROSI
MRSLGTVLKHLDDLFPLLKLKRTMKHAEKQIPPEFNSSIPIFVTLISGTVPRRLCRKMCTKMVRYPLEVLAIFDIVLMNMVGRLNPLFEKRFKLGFSISRAPLL